MKLIIDSSLLIDVLRGGNAGDTFIEKAERDDAELFIPTVVIFELFSGQSANDSAVRQKIQNLINNFRRVEFSEDIALRAGELYRQFGKQIGVSDYIIAASALEIGGLVATLNTKHFTSIPDICVYSFRQ